MFTPSAVDLPGIPRVTSAASSDAMEMPSAGSAEISMAWDSSSATIPSGVTSEERSTEGSVSLARAARSAAVEAAGSVRATGGVGLGCVDEAGDLVGGVGVGG